MSMPLSMSDSTKEKGSPSDRAGPDMEDMGRLELRHFDVMNAPVCCT